MSKPNRKNPMMTLDGCLAQFWSTYRQLSPLAQQIQQILSGQEPPINDHIAFRTFNLDPIQIEQIAQPFLKFGYQAKGSYIFTAKKLQAKHFEHPKSAYPKIFISQLQVDQFSPFVQDVAQVIKQQVADTQSPTDGLFLTSGRCWPIQKQIYDQLLAESEYAAWLYVFGFVPNHFTILVNKLSDLTDLASVNQRLKDHGFCINDSGGEIKGSPSVGLEQSSTLAAQLPVQFDDLREPISIPACYYEFAKRYHGFSGFVTDSADKIFESTNAL